MGKHIFAMAFSAAVMIALPKVPLTAAQAWEAIMLFYATGVAIACWAEENHRRWKDE